MIEYDFVGVDVSKNKFDVCIIIGERPLSACFDNNLKGFKQFRAWLAKHTTTPWVCLEATGSYSECIAEYLYASSIQVSTVNPMRVKNYAKSILARNKNDRLDARVICLFSKVADLRPFAPRSKAQKHLREQVQLLDTLERQKYQLKNQQDALQTKDGKKIYKKIIAALEKQICALEESITSNVQKNAQQQAMKDRLMTIKGIGEKSAHALMAYLPDIQLFEQAKQLAAYAGLSPKQWQSGTLTGKTTLSKFGSAPLRKALYMPAIVAKNHNPGLKAFCERLKENGLSPKAIIGAVMRKLIHIIYGMLKHGQDFQPELA